MAEETRMEQPRAVTRRFKGPRPDGSDGVWWYEINEVAETEGWKNVASLERGRYLRPLQYDETIVEGPDGRSMVAKRDQAGAQPRAASQRERASSSGDESASEDVAPADSSEETEPEAPAEEETPDYELEDSGGGWYNVLVDGQQQNERPIRGEENAREWANENLKEGS